jgi:hypothetical protein
MEGVCPKCGREVGTSAVPNPKRNCTCVGGPVWSWLAERTPVEWESMGVYFAIKSLEGDIINFQVYNESFKDDWNEFIAFARRTGLWDIILEATLSKA